MDKREAFKCWSTLLDLVYEIDEGKYDGWGMRTTEPMIVMNWLKNIADGTYEKK